MRYGVVWEQVLKDINREAMRLVLVHSIQGTLQSGHLICPELVALIFSSSIVIT